MIFCVNELTLTNIGKISENNAWNAIHMRYSNEVVIGCYKKIITGTVRKHSFRENQHE